MTTADARSKPAPPPSPAPAPSPGSKAAKGGAAALVALALAGSVAALRHDEGKKNVDYLDIAKVPTACFGHTGPGVRVGTVRTDAECEALLTVDARTHLDGVVACTPGLAAHPDQLAAATRLAYNIGTNAFCGSRLHAAFVARRWRAACDGFLAWRFADGRVVQGLVARRQRERAQCLTNLPAEGTY